MSFIRCKPIVAVVLVFSMLCASVSLAAEIDPYTGLPEVTSEEPQAEDILLDVALIRPVSFLGFLVGSVCWIVAAPLAAIADGSDGYETVTKKLVMEPAAYTFSRTVGEL